MKNRIRYTLGRNERLKSRKMIEQLFKEGKAFSVFPVRAVYLLHESDPGGVQAGFTVSTKYFKKATQRNRIRRLIKESWRLQKNMLDEEAKKKQLALSVFLIYTGNEVPAFLQIKNCIESILKRLQKIMDENSITDK